MGSRFELGIQPGDIATTVRASIVSESIDSTVSLAPDDTWETAAHWSGPDAKIIYDVTVFEVTEVDEYNTFGTVIASTRQDRAPGSRERVHNGFTNYVGGENNPTDAQLHRAGVEIHQVLDVQADGNVSPGIQVVQPWRTVEEYRLHTEVSQIDASGIQGLKLQSKRDTDKS
jgi:hypothetical protein